MHIFVDHNGHLCVGRHCINSAFSPAHTQLLLTAYSSPDEVCILRNIVDEPVEIPLLFFCCYSHIDVVKSYT
jgi:hypothetical protein